MEEHARRDAEELEEENNSDASDSNNLEVETYTNEDLLDNGVPEMAEAWEVVPLKARSDMLRFEAGSLRLDALQCRINQGTNEYLAVFLKRAGMKLEKIPKGSKPIKYHCMKWGSE